MRAVVQKVKRAQVIVDNKTISSIKQGLCVLVGITHDDTDKDMEFIAKKILKLRLFQDDNDSHWKKSVADLNYEILSVSQFTLYAETRKGYKPDFHKAMKSLDSKKFYQDFLDLLKSMYNPEKIKDGEFGAMMDVELVNDGPITIQLDSRKNETE